MNNEAMIEFNKRNVRVQKMVSLQEADCVPFIPNINNFYALHYDVTIKDAMEDNRNLIPAFQKYLKEYNPDLVMSPCFYPNKPMETAGFKSARWPGEYWNLPDNTAYQYVDSNYLEDDEYDEYLKDPSAFLMKKVFADRYEKFKGLKYLDMQTLCGHSIFSLSTFGMPEVQEALQAMLKTGQEINESIASITDLIMSGIELGYPVFGSSVACNPFDDFANNIRGLLATCMDIVSDPELAMEAINRWADISIPEAVAYAKMTQQQYTMIPLHCGMDNFMSLSNYNKYYWPPLKRLLNALIDANITPVVICEGKYHSRLETLTDVPSGKVMYIFEDVDFKDAKRILTGHASFGGGIKSQHLMPGGSPGRIKEEVKKLMDICAPGGGYFMCNSLSLDIATPKLMNAWREATAQYGAY